MEQIKINYAKTAKIVDVKALKETLWREIKEQVRIRINRILFSIDDGIIPYIRFQLTI